MDKISIYRIMKKTALILGILSLCTLVSCKCDFDEDEPRNKYPEENTTSNKSIASSESDSLNLRR
jgi:hypothetical protein